jgi:hypothetical protein
VRVEDQIERIDRDDAEQVIDMFLERYKEQGVLDYCEEEYDMNLSNKAGVAWAILNGKQELNNNVDNGRENTYDDIIEVLEYAEELADGEIKGRRRYSHTS